MKLNKKKFHLVFVVMALIGFYFGSAIGSGPPQFKKKDPATVMQGGEQPVAKEIVIASEMAGDEILTIAGTVTKDFQLVTSKGVKYDIAENKQGEEMLKHVGENVIAKGRLTIINEQKLFTVISYKLSEK